MPVNFNLGDLIPKELLNKVYDDALSGSAKQVGKLSEDTLKRPGCFLPLCKSVQRSKSDSKA